MSKLFVIAAATVLGAFHTKTAAQNEAKGTDGSFVAESAADLYENMSEGQIRLLRAHVAARVEGADDLETKARNLFELDRRFNTRDKQKMRQAQYAWNEMSEHFAPAPLPASTQQEKTVSKNNAKTADQTDGQTTAAEPKVKKPNVKDRIRELFPNVGDEKTLEEIKGDAYSDVSVTTGVSDLKSEKYAKGSVMTLKRIKAEDGTISYRREA